MAGRTGNGTSDESDDDSSDQDSEDNGGLVLVKKRHVEGGSVDEEGRGEDDEADAENVLELNTGKAKKMRITRDGVATAAASLAKKKVFDEDGEAVVSESCVRSRRACGKCQ